MAKRRIYLGQFVTREIVYCKRVDLYKTGWYWKSSGFGCIRENEFFLTDPGNATDKWKTEDMTPIS